MAGGSFKASTTLHWCVFINPLAWLLIIIDLIIFLLAGLPAFCKNIFAKTWGTVTVNGARRFWTAENGLKTTPFDKLTTAYELAARSFTQWAGRDALGTRTFLGWHKKEGVKYPLKLFGETTWQTYDSVGVRAHNFGKGLVTLGMVPLPKDEGTVGGVSFEQTSEPHTLLVYEETCADWMTGVIGAFSQSFCVATSYATLGISSVADAAQECNVKVILCNLKDVEKVAKEAGSMPMLTHIVYTTNYCNEEDIARLTAQPTPGKATVLSFDDVCARGESSDLPINKPTPDNMAVIMYTSGSTGKPKGVMIRQKNICASVAALYSYATNAGLVEGEETYLAYLPAAHILELCAEFAMFVFGAKIGYCDPKTISSKGAVRRMPNGELSTQAVMSYDENTYPPGGIQEFRPTFMAAVPKIWDILKKGVEDGVGKKSPIVQGLFNMAFAYKNFMLNMGADAHFFNAILFSKKFKPILGGRQKLFVSGGGPIAGEVQTFIRVVFSTPCVQGYALTETTCAGSVQFPTDSRNGVVGPPVSSVEIRLRDCVEDEMDVEGKPTGKTVPSVMDRDGRPYLSSDTTHYGAAVAGRGEVLIRGPSVSSGYLKKPEKTAAEFDEDGWFHSGDIAVFTTDGCIRIVDRLKNLVKLKGGEYIAIESMEKEFGKSVYVDAVGGGIMCYGDGDMDRPVALVIANIPEIRKTVGKDEWDDEALCQDPDVLKVVLNDLNKEGNTGGLGRNELLAGIALISGQGSPDEVEINSPWTPENGMLTASNKLNRRPIMAAYESVLTPLKSAGIR